MHWNVIYLTKKPGASHLRHAETMEATVSYLSKYNANLDCLINSEANQFTDPESSTAKARHDEC